MKFIRHCYYAIRYGKWDIDWMMYKDKPMFTAYHFYYDGNYAGIHLYKLHIGVYY